MDEIGTIFANVREHMSGGKCPTPGCLGECAIIAPFNKTDDGRIVYFAACYIWDTNFNDSAQLASWFQEAGAAGVTVSHVLFDEDNGDRDGKAGDMGDCRAWHVYFVLKSDTVDRSEIEAEKVVRQLQIESLLAPAIDTRSGFGRALVAALVNVK